jgi:hypothetical protein
MQSSRGSSSKAFVTWPGTAARTRQCSPTKPGARLAQHVAVGHVGQLSESGRLALADLYRLTQAALTVEPGLDTNTFVDRVTDATTRARTTRPEASRSSALTEHRRDRRPGGGQPSSMPARI